MSDTPTDPTTPEPTDGAPTEPVAALPPATDPPASEPVAAQPPPVGPPIATPSVTHAVAEPDKKRAWLRTGLITGAALVLAGLIFSAGVAVGWVGGRFDRFDRRDQVGDRMEQVFGDSDRKSRRDRIEECFFSNDSGRRDDSCPPFMRDDDGRFDEGRGNGSRGSDGRGGPGQSGRIDDGELPVPPVGGQGNTGSSTDQPVIVYPDGRVVPLEPNTTAPAPPIAPTPVPIAPTPVPIAPTPPVTPPAGQ